jgi:hypothetical protein
MKSTVLPPFYLLSTTETSYFHESNIDSISAMDANLGYGTTSIVGSFVTVIYKILTPSFTLDDGTPIFQNKIQSFQTFMLTFSSNNAQLRPMEANHLQDSLLIHCFLFTCHRC